MDSNSIFALDIGTRKVAGLVMRKVEEDTFEILDAKMIEHSSRAMIDGQIHDVKAVAETISKIKKALEDSLNIKLESAAVAAAGRALKTATGNATINRDVTGEIISEEVRALELEAVQKAQYNLAQEKGGYDESSVYFCVGYSVIRYFLEGQEITNLVGHIGNSASVEVVATFLPRVVVDSLISALNKANLDIYSLTLEPIAALSIAIPKNMRLLNLALVDVGAGTSDIAIVKSGNVYSYAMVPIGGDELTEHIATEYLLDFNSAEILKCELSDKEEITFTDIIENEITITSSEIINNLQSIIADLTTNITGQILSLNQKAPDAILCIGGGSLIPTFTDSLAETTGLPKNRVGIRARQTFKNIIGEFDFLNGPKGVTPLGIAYNSIEKPPVQFVKVTVNNKEVVLWNTGEIDVALALLSSGISLNNIYGKPGMGKTIEINGNLKVIKGEIGTPPVLKVNNKTASLDTLVKNGDIIEFTKGTDGKDAILKVQDLTPGETGYVYVNGEKIQLEPKITIDGKNVTLEDEISDRAKVEYHRRNTLDYILNKANVPSEYLQETMFKYYINEQEMILRWIPIKVKVDGKEVQLNETISFGAVIEYQLINEKPTIKDVLNIDNETIEILVTVNGEEVNIEGSLISASVEGNPVPLDKELFSGINISIEKNQTPAILSDIFKVIDIKPNSTGKLVLKVDGNLAGFTTPIYDGSNIEILWE
ncbi:Cell division protein FtsA, extended form [Candidatus Syntrophocurvum alkaliphilum]|uniref:Cell division protein FtsA, extended form n=1 Tax=Candidatus Syntrophocurvum alkaliphilum TaxID=2293317 RepID=A0A6I6DE42_9FIRM|nr:cell division FtsA domain-containing protein [Candidatus Syntrophocurvum alkaliphilum]QGU00742.1 Cell division protein FtsA, extended form [Candidatus Syntrophocurvum alkaliphilum]